MNRTNTSSVAGVKRKRDSKSKFYSVRIGRAPGVYHTWDECLEQVKGFPKATFKSFTTLTEAQNFLQEDGSANGKVSKWYGVRSGRMPGVYTSYAEVLEQISGWKNAKHRSFQTRSEAERYVSDTAEPPEPSGQSAEGPDSITPTAKKSKVSRSKKAAAKEESHSQEDEAGAWEAGDGPLPEGAEDSFDSTIILDQTTGNARYKTAAEHAKTKYVATGLAPNAPIKIYTDGSSLANGTAQSVSGVGVYFGPKDARNVSEPLSGLKQTNQRAELTAILRALEVAPRDRKVIISSDSNYSIKCITEWFHRWRTNGWVNSAKKPVDNKDLVQKILDTLEERLRVNRHRVVALTDDQGGTSRSGAGGVASGKEASDYWNQGPAGVKFVWVKGHADDEGNNAADRLATQAAREAKEFLAHLAMDHP